MKLLYLNKRRKSFKNCEVSHIYSSIVAVGLWSFTVCQSHQLPWACHRVWCTLEFLLYTCHCQGQFTFQFLIQEYVIRTGMLATIAW